MELIGTYQGRKTYWWDFDKFEFAKLPTSDWLCLAIANEYPNEKLFNKFAEACIRKNISEFKGQGFFGEQLHHLFDLTMIDIELKENIKPFEIMTTWHNDEILADVFWQCHFATCLPETTNYDNISIVCTSLSGQNKTTSLKSYIEKFKKGWIPD